MYHFTMREQCLKLSSIIFFRSWSRFYDSLRWSWDWDANRLLGYGQLCLASKRFSKDVKPRRNNFDRPSLKQLQQGGFTFFIDFCHFHYLHTNADFSQI